MKLQLVLSKTFTFDLSVETLKEWTSEDGIEPLDAKPDDAFIIERIKDAIDYDVEDVLNLNSLTSSDFAITVLDTSDVSDDDFADGREDEEEE